MKTEWSSSAFGGYMNSLLKRYFAEENLISPGAVELRAAWRTPQFVYCVFSVMRVTRGLAYVGMELPPIPSTGGVSSEEDTAVKVGRTNLLETHLSGTWTMDQEIKSSGLGKSATTFLSILWN